MKVIKRRAYDIVFINNDENEVEVELLANEQARISDRNNRVPVYYSAELDFDSVVVAPNEELLILNP